jgi:MoaA/NifB/PqqE/SkfB family radical SAM enzyme
VAEAEQSLPAGEASPAFRSPTGIAPVLQVHPTRRCNLACQHCYTSSGPAVDEQLDLELLLACLDDAAALGYRQLAVSGGEPLLYKRLPDLLMRARALGMLTSLTTNGMLATPSRWGPISGLLDVAAISIDGRPQEHDLMRGQHGAFAKTLTNLAVLRASGVPFSLIFTLTQHNVDSLEYVVQLAAREGARGVQVHPLTLYGRAADTLPDSRPDTLELWVALAEAARLGHQLGIAVQVDALSMAQLLAYRNHLVPERPITHLTNVAPVLIAQADGAVLPLTHDISRRLWLGSLHQRRLKDLAPTWIASGCADQLAIACELAWRDTCADSEAGAAVYWYDQVAAASRMAVGTTMHFHRL